MILKFFFTASLAVSAHSQYFAPLHTKDAVRDLSSRLSMATIKKSFDDSRAASTMVLGSTLTFTPSVASKGATIAELAKGRLIGRWTATGPSALGAARRTRLEAGSYDVWLARTGGIWVIAYTDSKNKVVAVTNEVSLFGDKRSRGRHLGSIKAAIYRPPYPLTRENGTVIPLADEGPGTVHGCFCETVEVCGETTEGLTICWKETVCSCWNEP